VLYGMSCLVFLEPHEEAVLERFGKPRAGAWHLQPGFHFKLPWPFETIQRVPARRVMTAWIGLDADDATNRPAVITWSVPHYRKEDTYVVASRVPAGGSAVPAGLVSVNIPVEYRVTNLLAYVYGTRDPEKLILSFGNRALTRAAAGHDLADFLGPRRAIVAAELQVEVQKQVDAAGLGVEILFTGMQGAHPPVQVAEAFESVIGALEQRDAAILNARAYTNEILPIARANAEKLQREAEAYRVGRGELASAEVDQFEKRRAAHKTAPEVFRANMYLNTLRDSLAGARKYIVDAPGSKQVLMLNLEEKPYQDLLDLGAPLEPVAGGKK
jgi:HflK protein